MANFNTHISVAFVASGVTGLVIYKAGMLTAPEYLMCVVAGTIGGLLPDIDLDHSVPATVGFNVVSLLSAFFIVILCVGQFSLVALAVSAYAVYLVVSLGEYVETLKKNIKNSNALYDEQNKYSTKKEMKWPK